MSSLSVIVTTHNRPDGVVRALQSIRAVDTPVDTEIVVVDDGSRPAAASALDALSGDGVVVVHQADLGLGAARVHGVQVSRGAWVTFLDDDDEWLPGWASLASLVEQHDPASGLRTGVVGVVSGAARLCDPGGRVLRDDPPRPLGPLYSDLDAQYLAGCWAVRRDLYERAGGYLPGLCASHQSELFIRIGAISRELSLETRTVHEPVARIERRATSRRSLSNPRLVYDGTRWVLARHREHFDLDPIERANWEGQAAVNGARVGDPAARGYARRAARLDRRNPRALLRAIVMHTPAWRRAWGTSTAAPGSPSHAAPLLHAGSLRHAPCVIAEAVDLDFLPWRYRTNAQASADAEGTPFWEKPEINDTRFQAPVYRMVAQMARREHLSVLDIGCGSGDKLIRQVAPVARRWWGVDQPSAIDEALRRWGPADANGTWLATDLTDPSVWDDLVEQHADLIVCADVIEHLDDPQTLLANLRRFADRGARVVLSTPDRSRVEGRTLLGPPDNPRHVREWSEPELRLLVESAGFRVERSRHLLPRSYSPTVLEAKRFVHRLLHRRALPDRRTCMAMVLVAAEPAMPEVAAGTR